MTTTEQTKVQPRLKTRYREEIRDALNKEFAYANVMQIPGVVTIETRASPSWTYRWAQNLTSWPTAVRTAEPPHDEIKRTPLQTTLDLHVAVLAIREPDSIAGSLDSVALRPSPFVSPRACRRLLARASLGDIPLSA